MYPILAYINDFPIYTYYVIDSLGIIAGFIVLFFNMKPLPQKTRAKIFLFAALIFIPFILGARLGSVLENFILKVPSCAGPGFNLIGPVSLWWGLMLAVLSAFPIARFLKLNVWETADLFSMSIATGGVFARLGCFFNGCCYGIKAPETFPFSVIFPVFPYDPSLEIARYPVQLYYSFSWLIIFIILSTRNSKKLFTGELMLDMTILFSISVFFIDFYRYHNTESLFTITKTLSMIFIIICICIYYYFVKKRKT